MVSSSPISCEIDKKNKLVITAALGPFTADDIWQVRARLLRDRDFDISFSHLVDLGRLTQAAVTGDQVRRLAESVLFSPESRCAFLARQERISGLSRMLEIHCCLRGDERISVFRERNEALAWLQKKR
jgi:hypothetical protein